MKNKIFIILLIFTLNSCFNDFQEPIVPTWDVSLTIPITKEYTLGEILDNVDNSKFTFDSKNDSLILYNTTLKLNPISLNNPDYIKINTPSKEGHVKISDIKFSLKEKFVFDNKISEIFPNIPLNSNTIIPRINNINYSKEISLKSFNLVSIDSANMNIEIENNFPFDIVIDNLILQNNDVSNTSVIFSKSNILINKFSKVILSEIIINKNISNNQKILITLSTPGTGQNNVFISSDQNLKISFDAKDIKILYADASFDEQKYNFSLTSSLINYGNDIEIKESKIKNGKMVLLISNSTNINSRIKSELPELKYNNINFNTGDIFISSNSQIIKTYYLNDYVLRPQNNKDITINSTLTINSTNNNFIQIHGNDSIHYRIELKDIEIQSFSGSIKGNINQSFHLPKDDIDKYFNGNIKFENIDAKLIISNGSDIPFKISNSKVIGYNKITNKYENFLINDAIIQANNKTNIPLDKSKFTNFINSFTQTNSLPDYFDFNTDIEMTTNNQNYLFSNKDTLSGAIFITIPLLFSTDNINYTDSLDYELSDSDKKEIEKLNYGLLTIKTTKKIPLNGNLRIRFYNTNTKKTLTFPKNIGNNYYLISSAEKDEQGNSIKESITIIQEEFSKDNITFLKEANLCFLDFVLNTNNKLSRLKRSDKIKFNITSEFGYKVK
ncbi:MAG TPA: hypothetical protein VIR55_04885 [Ignavibacteria bacterium]|jgi:hypothetical protein